MWQPVLDACHIIFKINPSKCYLFNLWAWFSVNRTHLTATFSHNLYLIINFLINARSIIVARKWIEWQKFATKLTKSICFWGLSDFTEGRSNETIFEQLWLFWHLYRNQECHFLHCYFFNKFFNFFFLQKFLRLIFFWIKKS